MAMNADDIVNMIKAAINGAQVELIDLAGDGDHYKAIIKSPDFSGLSRIAQHQMVYAALKGKMGGELHALALETHAI